MKKLSPKAEVIVYTEDVNEILRGLHRDLSKYLDIINTGHCRTVTGFHDATFSHWFSKLASRHFCRKPVKKVKLVNDFVSDGCSFGQLIPLQQKLVNPHSESYDIFKDFKVRFDVLINSHDLPISSQYDKGFIDALNDVYKLIHDVEMPFLVDS